MQRQPPEQPGQYRVVGRVAETDQVGQLHRLGGHLIRQHDGEVAGHHLAGPPHAQRRCRRPSPGPFSPGRTGHRNHEGVEQHVLDRPGQSRLLGQVSLRSTGKLEKPTRIRPAGRDYLTIGHKPWLIRALEKLRRYVQAQPPDVLCVHQHLPLPGRNQDIDERRHRRVEHRFDGQPVSPRMPQGVSAIADATWVPKPALFGHPVIKLRPAQRSAPHDVPFLRRLDVLDRDLSLA